jgi:Tfp pilus assembly protein PilX
MDAMESEVERLVRERTRELEAANAALRKSEQMLATEIDAAQRLQIVATQLMVAQGTEALHEQILRFYTPTSLVSRWFTRSGEPPGN